MGGAARGIQRRLPEGQACMAKFGFRREDLGMQGIGYGDQLGPRWYRLLFQGEAMQAVHIGPVGANSSSAWADGRPKSALPTPIDANTPITDDMNSPPLGLYHGAADDGHLPGFPGQEVSGNFAILHTASFAWQSRYVYDAPIAESSVGSVNPAVDTAESPGLLSNAEHDLFTDQSPGNLSTAFLPPGDHDAPLTGFDAGMPLMPPPPEII
jgi:hypothetical protein